MTRFIAPIILLAVAALAGPAAAEIPVPVALQGNVGPGFTITLTDPTGAAVKHLDPGDYAIHVVDQSTIHNFDLAGPGVHQATSVTDVDNEDWQVTFIDGTYVFLCDAHPYSMKGTFTVGNVPAAVPKLAGTVGPGSTITLPRTAKAGKTIITIHDRTKKDNFHLIGPGVNKKTGVAFTGTVKWTVTLRAGIYTFRSDAHKALKKTLKVSAPA